MPISPENHALLKEHLVRAEIGDGVEMLSFFPDTLNRLLDAARSQGLAKVTYLPKIKVAELCYGFGWQAGYESALKGPDGVCLSQAWRDSPAQALIADDDAAGRAALEQG